MDSFSPKRPALNVAVIVYNRPDLAELTLTRVVQAKPDKLFIIADGPKSDSPDDKRRVEETRKKIRRLVSGINVEFNFSDANLGLRRRVETGLDWAFSRVSSLIILEDDCVPDLSFFDFCNQLLYRYESHPLVGRISAECRWDSSESPLSYELVQSSGIWGWATWRDQWQEFRKWSDDNEKIPFLVLFRDLTKTPGLFRKVVRIRLFGKRQNLRAWGVRLSIFMKLRNLYGISPRVDLVTNLGFGRFATNTYKQNLPAPVGGSLSKTLAHPEVLAANLSRERLGSRREWRMFLRHNLAKLGVSMGGDH